MASPVSDMAEHLARRGDDTVSSFLGTNSVRDENKT